MLCCHDNGLCLGSKTRNIRVIMLVTLLVKFRNKDCKTTKLELLLQVLPVRIVTIVETLGSHLKLKHFHCDDLHIILSLSAVQIYDYFIYSYSFLHLRDKYELTIDQLPLGLIAQLVRALHRYGRGHGFDSRSSLNFFRFLLFNCFLFNCFNCFSTAF